jgi:hypothetical protein
MARTPEEIRNSIDQQRGELVSSVDKLRGEVEKTLDWRAHVRRHEPELVLGAVAFGTLIVGRALLRRRRRRRAR